MDIRRIRRAHFYAPLAHLRLLGCCAATLTFATLPVTGQIEEPILTKSALVFTPASGSLKLDYAGSLVQVSPTGQIIPEFTLQAGVSSRLEGMLRFPLLGADLGNGTTPVIGGGQLAAGAKYLLMGGPAESWAISAQATVEAPTGDSRLVGNATQVMPGMLADWRLTRFLISYTNVSWNLSIGGTGKRVSLITYESALVLATQFPLKPVLEFAGSTNSSTGRTQAVFEPGVLLRRGPHLEVKVGVPAGLNANSPTLGLHAQLAIFWHCCPKQAKGERMGCERKGFWTGKSGFSGGGLHFPLSILSQSRQPQRKLGIGE